MATFQAIFAPATANATSKVTALAATTSSAEILLGKDAKFAIVATGNVNIKFGQPGMTAADATGWLIPSGGVAEFDLANAWTSIRVFNPNASTVDIYVLQLSN